MDPQFTVFVGTLLALLVLTVAIAIRVRKNRERSFARVEALQELVAEYSGPSGSQVLGSTGPTGPESDDWDLRLHAEGYDDVPEYDDAPEVALPAAAASAAPDPHVFARTHRFVVHVPDAGGAPRWQVSFQEKESRT